MTTKECDLLIIGGGPAGLSAAINGASEGLAVTLLDNGSTFGGQARESSAIENYPGFPAGITGEHLVTALVAQAYKFATDMICPLGATALSEENHINNGRRLVVTTDDYTEFRCKSVILSLGLSYRRLQTHNLPRYLGNGVYYGMPPNAVQHTERCDYVIVGGANSAGQAAMHLCKHEDATVHMVMRGAITDKMSKYLQDRILSAPNIVVHEHTTVEAIEGDINGRLSRCFLVKDNKSFEMPCRCLFIFIGAMPRTFWLSKILDMDENNYIKTWQDFVGIDRLPFETSIRGVFAAGDVRLGSTKRVATAVGEGANALQMIHRYLATLEK